MRLQKIQVVYRPEPDIARTYLHEKHAGTLGLKLDTDLGQYGLWEFLPEPHTIGDVLTLLAELAEKTRFGLLDLALSEGVPPRRMVDVLGDRDATGKGFTLPGPVREAPVEPQTDTPDMVTITAAEHDRLRAEEGRRVPGDQEVPAMPGQEDDGL